MTLPGLPAGMTPHEFVMWWTGGRAGSIANLASRARVLTNLVPQSVLQHLSTFERSRLVLLVERIGEYGSTAAQRALRPSERQALLRISRGINQIVASGRASAAEQAVLSRGAQAQMRWVEQVNLRRAGARGIFGTLGVGGTVIVASLVAILAVGLYANARQTAVMEAIRAMNTAGGDPGEIVYGTPPPEGEQGECLQDEAASRGLVWTGPDGEPCAGRPDCSWRAPEAVPEPLWSTIQDTDALETARAQYQTELALFAAPRLAESQRACGIGQPSESSTPRSWPIPDDMCDFIPGWLTRTPQPAINGAGTQRQCVAAETSPDGGTPIWVEVMVPDGESPSAAEQWLSLVPGNNSLSGTRTDLDIGDRAVLYVESRRHVLAGIVGPVGYVLYASVDGGRTGDLEATAVGIVNLYLDWANQQG
jgi:hypothetical protein